MKLHGERYERKKCESSLHMVDREKYFKIWGFMREDLRLEKTELLVYAQIFSFYKSNGSDFRGSRKYLCDWSGAGRTAVDNALKSLVKKNYITAKVYTEWGIARVAYAINIASLPRCEMFKEEHDRLDFHEKHKEEIAEYGRVTYQRFLDEEEEKNKSDIEAVRAHILRELQEMREKKDG